MFLTIQHLIGQRRISRVAIYDKAVRDEVGRSAAQADLMTIEDVPTILNNDIRMRFKDRDELLGSREEKESNGFFLSLGKEIESDGNQIIKHN